MKNSTFIVNSFLAVFTVISFFISFLIQAKEGRYKSRMVQAYYINKNMASNVCTAHFNSELKSTDGIQQMCLSDADKRLITVQILNQNLDEALAAQYCSRLSQAFSEMGAGFVDGGYKKWKLNILGMESPEGIPDAVCDLPKFDDIFWNGETFESTQDGSTL